MEVACDRHVGNKEKGLAFQIALRSKNIDTHGRLTTAARNPEVARAIMRLLKETADQMQALLEGADVAPSSTDVTAAAKEAAQS